ncbi:hypothetical protein MFU01_55190 [Myxococcus fulvus]|uniref:Uncharacterized protein n=1 Tax=Myxococcus fulvus TaxID=33 RepID=A0A511TAH9_MYXFU|nr:hypothetical protein MFU01_55190 [Myxococcus fulvus]
MGSVPKAADNVGSAVDSAVESTNSMNSALATAMDASREPLREDAGGEPGGEEPGESDTSLLCTCGRAPVTLDDTARGRPPAHPATGRPALGRHPGGLAGGTHRTRQAGRSSRPSACRAKRPSSRACTGSSLFQGHPPNWVRW